MQSLLLKICFIAIFAGQSLFAVTGDEDWEKVKAQIQEINKQWETAMLQGDKAFLMNIYVDDVISLPNFDKMLRGKDAVAAHFEGMMEAGFKASKVSFNTVELLGAGELAIEIGTYSMTFQMPGMESEMDDTGKYLTVWKKQDDGSWKVKTEIWNTDMNPMQMEH